MPKPAGDNRVATVPSASKFFPFFWAHVYVSYWLLAIYYHPWKPQILSPLLSLQNTSPTFPLLLPLCYIAADIKDKVTYCLLAYISH